MAVVELVQATTADGLRLDGSLQLPSAGTMAVNGLPIDAVICLHGAGSNFYGSSVFPAIAPTLTEIGVAVLRVNTRGHGLISTIAGERGPRRIGGTFETVDDCRFDIAAWVDFLAARGLRRVALVGHSLGAVKSIYAMAQARTGSALHEALHESVRAVVAVSPPRLSYSFFCQSPRAEDFLAEMTRAQALVAAGEGSTLMEVTFPLPYLIAAAGYVDKYGPQERYHILPLIERLARPALFVFGELELARNTAFAGLDVAVAALPAGSASRQVKVIPGANHFYNGTADRLADAIGGWLRGLAAE